MKNAIIAGTLLSLVACQPQTITNTVFVAQRDVPQKPSFVVFPANNYLYQVEFANEIEHYLIFCGISVQTRPATKEIEATKQATQVGAQPSQAASTQATLTERYLAFEDTDADYVVYTYADSRQVKIAQRQSKEILASFELKNLSKISERLVFRSALQTLGIPVRVLK